MSPASAPRSPFYLADGQLTIDLPGARAVFTDRTWGDLRQTVHEVGARLGVRPLRVHQTHGNSVRVALSASTADGPLPDADAIITTQAALAASVITADCLPIVVAASASAGTPVVPAAVAAIHAGWRGLDAGVIAAAIASLRKLAPAASLSAAIGPAAGPCCYQVGQELHDRFPGFSRADKLDLKAIARAELSDAGVTTIHDCGICTICDPTGRWFSYRREGATTGRQGVLACVR